MTNKEYEILSAKIEEITENLRSQTRQLERENSLLTVFIVFVSIFGLSVLLASVF